jgi:hypothetical protein
MNSTNGRYFLRSRNRESCARVEGMEAGKLIAQLKGIQCGKRRTSCADQLACALATQKEVNQSTMSGT